MSNNGPMMDVVVHFVLFHMHLLQYYRNVEIISGDDPKCVSFKLGNRFVVEKEDLDVSADC